MKLSPTLALLLLAAPIAAHADDNRYFMFTGDGVADGVGRFALEGNALVVISGDEGAALPTLGLRYARGLAGPLDLRISVQTLVVYNAIEAGVGLAIVRTPNFGLGARLGLSTLFIVSDSGGGGIVAGTPGLVATLRGDLAALSIGADFPMYFNGFIITPSKAAAGTTFAPALRPNVAVEVGSREGLKFYVRVDATAFLVEGADGVLGNASVGVHF